MLISPPFLLPKQTNETDQDWIARCMVGDTPGQGGYPLSYKLEWHGGLHLTAPTGDDGRPVLAHAIADGTVVYLRKRTEAMDLTDPLNYGSGYTSDACVVIEHVAEIGDGANATNARFYSLYHHLFSISDKIKLNKPIRRKEEIGQAGHIYGEPSRMHFEICCDDANLQKLTGRLVGELSTAQNGRTDTAFGEMYFYLPVGTPIYDQKPLHYLVAASHIPAHSTNIPALAPQALTPVYTTMQASIAGIRYAEGDGAIGQRGDAWVTTYYTDGRTEGAALREHDAEYNLYRTAMSIAQAWQQAHAQNLQQVPDVPSVSAVFELLRFGRVIGPEMLNPTTAPHWREIRYPGGQGWANLNAGNVRQFSDADFPHWKGWKLIDDDTDGDAACDSPTIKKWLDADGNGIVECSETHSQLNVDSVRAKLKRTVCKFPSEWDPATIDKRWEWLKWRTDGNPDPLTEENFAELKAHIQALSIPCADFISAQWRFEPREFIAHFRKCWWVGGNELAQIFPHATAANRQLYGIHIAKCCRKYFINSTYRLGHFFGQAAVESGQLRWMSEIYNGNPFDYFRRYERARNYLGWLGNVQWNDGGTFRGRGFKQMTGRANYSNYWVYKGWLDANSYTANWWRNVGWWGILGNYVNANHHNLQPIQNAQPVAQLMAQLRPPIIDQPERVQTEPEACIDTAGWFWGKNSLIRIADRDDFIQMTNRIRGDNATVPADFPVAAHFTERRDHTNRIKKLVGE